MEEAELILAERVGFGKDLRHARAVAKVSEADGTLAPAGMQKPGNSDLLADKVRAFALDVAKRVGAVGRGCHVSSMLAADPRRSSSHRPERFFHRGDPSYASLSAQRP